MLWKVIGLATAATGFLVFQGCDDPEFVGDETGFEDSETVEGIAIDGDFIGVPVTFGPHCSGSQSSTGSINGAVTKIQSVGDSFLDFNSESQNSIPQKLGKILSVPVSHNAEGGTTLNGRDIQRQYERDGASHVLISGGGNDLAAECSRENLDSLISADSKSGYMVDIVEQVTNDGAQALVMGYFTPINRETPCEYFDELFDRYRQLGAHKANTAYVCTLDTITPDQPELYADSIHPSPLGSTKIASKLARLLQ